LSALVRNSVEETLNTLMDEEAQRLCNAEKYSRDEERQNRRAGNYSRQL
jgi:putative transposase